MQSNSDNLDADGAALDCRVGLYGGSGAAGEREEGAPEKATKQRSEAKASAKAEREHGTATEARRRDDSRDGATRPATTPQMVSVRSCAACSSCAQCRAYVSASVLTVPTSTVSTVSRVCQLYTVACMMRDIYNLPTSTD